MYQKKKIKTNNRICHIRVNLSRNIEKQVIMFDSIKDNCIGVLNDAIN